MFQLHRQQPFTLSGTSPHAFISAQHKKMCLPVAHSLHSLCYRLPYTLQGCLLRSMHTWGHTQCDPIIPIIWFLFHQACNLQTDTVEVDLTCGLLQMDAGTEKKNPASTPTWAEAAFPSKAWSNTLDAPVSK